MQGFFNTNARTQFSGHNKQKMEYTITKSLSLLKTLKARYNKELNNLECIAVKHGSKLRRPYSSYKPDDFKVVDKVPDDIIQEATNEIKDKED